MALKALMLRKKIDDLKKSIEELRSVDFEAREAELAKAIEEASNEEERAACEEAVAAFEAEKTENTEKAEALQREVEGLEAELKECETEVPDEEEPAPTEERKGVKKMEVRTLKDMSLEQRDAFFKREDVANFMAEIRTAIKEKRAISNIGLTIPEVMVPMIRTKVEEASKLLPYVNLQRVAGSARAVVMGTIPEAVWTEMCANLNDLAIAFNDVEVDGYKVGGYFAVCNAAAEDEDVDLMNNLIEALGEAIGYALDKAIVYGKGVKMPLGFVTRLAQTTEPSGYPATARTWVDLHTSNVKTGTGAVGLNLFKEIFDHEGICYNAYAKDGMVWVMNHKTASYIRKQSIGTDASAMIVAGMNDEMPVIGGKIIELPFMPDYNVACGYFDAYLLAERAGTTISTSEHAKFIEDKTVLKGTARYDGQPAIAESFVIFTVTNTAPTTSIDFAQDSANPQ